jgi:ubiquitin carboxyl-terminal hydrolase 2/21
MMAMAMGRIKSKETTPSTVDSSFNNSHKDIKHSDNISAISPEVQLMNKKVAREESRKAWNSYLTLNDSVVTDIFAGQLQSTIECLTCRNKSFCFDPFLDLSVPIPKGKDIRGNWRRSTTVIEPTTCPLEECIEKFTGEEILDDDNMFTCSKCMEKRKCTKKLSIYKYPRVLVTFFSHMHISTLFVYFLNAFVSIL